MTERENPPEGCEWVLMRTDHPEERLTDGTLVEGHLTDEEQNEWSAEKIVGATAWAEIAKAHGEKMRRIETINTVKLVLGAVGWVRHGRVDRWNRAVVAGCAALGVVVEMPDDPERAL